jgi:hypothetical protein
MGSGRIRSRPEPPGAGCVFKNPRDPRRNATFHTPPSRLPKPLLPARSIGEITATAPRFFPPDPESLWQCKKPKTYAHPRCEQLVGKLALKWFFGSQLLRPRSVLSRHRSPFFPMSLEPGSAAPAVTAVSSPSSPTVYISPFFNSYLRLVAFMNFVTARRRREGDVDMLGGPFAGAV